ncbi:MAG: family 78 glycoside hydrolase catalytic domain [Eubacteriales bacterium]|nr:family 78 glycoside hydrolase catalytic domain [Eubacteriales bacterium]
MRLTDLRVNHVVEPMGYQMEPLSFSWKVEEAGEAKRQEAARARVFEGGKMVFDSGWDAKASSLDYGVELTLKPRTRYSWTVEMKADDGQEAAGQSWFETGKMGETWAGKWITPDLEADVTPVLRKQFPVSKAGEARIYICGLGLYEVYLNGKKVGNEYLAPGYHSFDFHVQAQTYDVTAYLHEGENEMQIWLGDGWFRGRFGFDSYTNLYGERCYALAELYVGEELVLATDESWECKESPVVEANIYDGEVYDARRERALAEEDGWRGVRLEEPERCGELNPVLAVAGAGPENVVLAGDGLRLCGEPGVSRAYAAISDRYSLPVVIKETLIPEWMETPKGEVLLDFKQNMTGWVEFDCCLPKGWSIRLTAAEILQDGCFYKENYRTAKAEFVYYSNGEPAHVRPHFTFYGFRYMKVEYLDADGKELALEGFRNGGAGFDASGHGCEAGSVAAGHDSEAGAAEAGYGCGAGLAMTEHGGVSGWLKNITGCHLRSDFDQTGWIVTGNADVNQLFSNALWGQKDNFLDVPTDCPQRDERLGWTGDAQVFSETACYNMYMPAFYRKYLWDMRAEQSILDGAGMNIVPRIKQGMVAESGICPWADAAAVIPWNVYRVYGSKTLLRECYPGMKAWVEFQRRREEAAGSKRLILDGFHFADWLALDNSKPGPLGATDPHFIASVYYYYSAKITAEAAKALDMEKDARDYAGLAEEILQAIQENYFDENGACVCRTQTVQVLCITFGLMPEKRQSQGETLAELIRENKGHLNTGFVGTPFLCPALTATGNHALATNLLLNEEFPGWFYSVKMGATTIWERWNSVEPDGHMNPEGMNSLNHYTYGSIEAWMYGDVCGIRPIAPGYKKAVIEPHPDKRLHFADMRLDTASGTYRVRWEYQEDETVEYRITVPFDAEAQVQIEGETKTLPAGHYTYRVCS